MADWRDVTLLLDALTCLRCRAAEAREQAMLNHEPKVEAQAERQVARYEKIIEITNSLPQAFEKVTTPLWSATLYGDPRTKKNSMRIVGGKAKCPRCGKPVKQWLVQSAQHDSFSREASKQITPPPKPIDRPVSCRYVFYTQTRRKVDGLNLEATIDDLLVRCHVLADDNSRIVIDHDGSRVRYDPDNPRVEITIFSSEEGDPQLALELD